MDELRIVLNADEQLRVDMQDSTPLSLRLQNPEIHTVTDNYEDLENKPSINSVELVGNKTTSDLGLQSELSFDNAPTEDSANPVKSGGVYDALSGKVNKSGDTMIGDLNIRNGHHFGVISPSIDTTTTPAEQHVQDVLGITDKNANSIGFVSNYQKTNGNIGFQLYAARPYNGGYALNGFVLEVAPDGTYDVGITAPMQWRKALNGQDIKVRSGTTVITPSAGSTSETVITSAQLATMFGITGSSPSNTTVVMSNGDYVANAVGVSSIYNSNVSGWKALFSEPISTPIRINWIAVYFGL